MKKNILIAGYLTMTIAAMADVAETEIPVTVYQTTGTCGFRQVQSSQVCHL